MKKQRNSAKQNAKRTPQSNAAGVETPTDGSRRNFLRLARNLALGAGVLGGTGYALARTVMGTVNEHDLSRVGNGTPTIVQIHDPNCSLCRGLQRETRKALGVFDDGELDYVVANIKSQKGLSFANRYGVQHVTLLLFDGKGELKRVLEGQRMSRELTREFRQLVRG
jgi:hypothetical protein